MVDHQPVSVEGDAHRLLESGHIYWPHETDRCLRFDHFTRVVVGGVRHRWIFRTCPEAMTTPKPIDVRIRVPQDDVRIHVGEEIGRTFFS
jgi:hypothetical protein